MLLRRLSSRGSTQLDDCVPLARCPCVIEANRDGDTIKFVFYDRAEILFYQGRSGEFYMVDRWGVDSLDQLPDHILAKISTMVVGPEPTFDFDIDKHTLSPPLPAILVVNGRIRRWSGPCMYDANIVVRCTLPNEVIDPEVFRDLRSWAEYGGFTWLRTWNLPSG